MKNYQRFILTLTIGFAALLAEFLFKNPTIAYMIVAITGGLIAIQMLIGMIATLPFGKIRCGYFGYYCHCSDIGGRSILG